MTTYGLLKGDRGEFDGLRLGQNIRQIRVESTRAGRISVGHDDDDPVVVSTQIYREANSPYLWWIADRAITELKAIEVR